MNKTINKNTAYRIEPLYMNRLRGRMLRLPPPANKGNELLIVYGRHGVLERLLPLAQVLNRYGGVTIPDLPGLGGMQPFYRLYEKPTLDNMADYLAAFIKLFYKRRRLTIIGLGFGFTVATRMLQKYPDLAKKVNMSVSIAGYVHHDDFSSKYTGRLGQRLGTAVLSWRLPSWLVGNMLLHPALFGLAEKAVPTLKSSKQPTNKQAKTPVPSQHSQWRSGDLRTQMFVRLMLHGLDVCKHQVDLPVYHVNGREDLFNNDVLEQHLNVIYKKVHVFAHKQKTGAGVTIPRGLRRVLAKRS